MSKKYNLYLGKSGQFAIMSEFLARGWNTCTPDVDVGDDVLVLEDRQGQFKRVQVKSATAIQRGKGYSVQFNLPFEQLPLPISPEIYYALMVRYKNKWINMLIISRQTLYILHIESNLGSLSNGRFTIYIAFQDGKATCSNTDFTPFIDNFSDFPDILH